MGTLKRVIRAICGAALALAAVSALAQKEGSWVARDFRFHTGELFGPGQPLDAARYFIILPDALGHGKSSKPSDGLRAKFPRYNYDDMVLAQHRLVTEGLGLQRLRLVDAAPDRRFDPQ